MTMLDRSRARTAANAGRERGARATAATQPATSALRRVLRPVSPFGWAVLVSALACWVLAATFDWVEFLIAAAAGLALFLACALMTIGRTRLRVEVGIDPERVTVGNPAAGQVRVTNAARTALLPVLLELPIGQGVARFTLPLLGRGVIHEELFVVPTERRGVVPIGPATTVRGDPLGLLRRTYAWTGVTELFVHPVTVPLESLGAGLLRDLEGQSTQDVSMSDLAFHALRDYQPGDDRRYIHWRSSAKAGRFLVRQFLDTRRSHVAVIVDSGADSYAHPDEYEIGISTAASVAVRALTDEQDLTVLAGEHAVPSSGGRRVLDTFARAELGQIGLTELCARATRVCPDASLALLITGSRLPYERLLQARAYFPPEVRTVVIRVDPANATSVRNVGGMTLLSLQTLTELPALVSGALT